MNEDYDEEFDEEEEEEEDDFNAFKASKIILIRTIFNLISQNQTIISEKIISLD